MRRGGTGARRVRFRCRRAGHHDLGLKPRRTIRVVLFTNEENGLAGGKGYAARHAAELGQHVAAIESDSGNGLAGGFTFQVPPVTVAMEPDASRERKLRRFRFSVQRT